MKKVFGKGNVRIEQTETNEGISQFSSGNMLSLSEFRTMLEKRRMMPASAIKKVNSKTINKGWEEKYRAKFEGANVWSSKAIDEQISFIQKLLKEEREDNREDKKRTFKNKHNRKTYYRCI